MNYKLLTKLLTFSVMMGLFAFQNIATAQTSLPVTDSLEMHLAADSLDLSDGDPVGQWEDLTGNGNHAEQEFTDLAAPTYVEDGIAGKPTVQFDASEEHFMNLTDVPIDVGNVTVFVMARFDAHDGDHYILSGQTDGDNRLRIASFGWTTNFIFGLGDNGAYETDLEQDMEPHLFTVTSEAKMYIDGADRGGFDNEVTGQPEYLTLGSFNQGEKSFFSGVISEVIIYSRQLSESEVSDVNEHLMEKYAIGTSVEEEMDELPDEIGLKQNYPNPFNPATTIQYQLPKATYVELSVYNILGQEVTTLVNEQMKAGVHQVSFDGSNLSSGLYLYRLQAGEEVITNKMNLVK